MTQERLPVRKIREVIRLHHEAGLSNRAIARVCKVSNSTVGEYLKRAELAGIGWPLPEGLLEDALYQQLFPEKAEKSEQILAKRDQELAEIKRSKAWKLALWLRRVRIMVIPPGSFSARLLKKSIGNLFLPVNKYNRYHALKNDVALVKVSGLFDETWYLSNNPDVAQAKMDPCEHYLLYGGFEGRDPGPNFSSGLYFQGNVDVKNAGINPLLHYLKYGKNEGRAAE